MGWESDPRVRLAVERTLYALERTQLAWVRTLLSMIGGGFVIDKGMQAFHQSRVAAGQAWVDHAHFAGMVITGFGTLLMILVTVLYTNRNREFNKMKGNGKTFQAPAFILSIMTIVLGMILIYFITLA